MGGGSDELTSDSSPKDTTGNSLSDNDDFLEDDEIDEE